MFDIPDLPKEVWYIFVGIIVIVVMLSSGTFWPSVETAVEGGKSLVRGGESMVDAGKTLCVAKDTIMEDLLKTVYDKAPNDAKQILDKYNTGEKLTDCDYFQLHTSLNKKNIRSWTIDESCNALVCWDQ